MAQELNCLFDAWVSYMRDTAEEIEEISTVYLLKKVNINTYTYIIQDKPGLGFHAWYYYSKLVDHTNNRTHSRAVQLKLF